MGEQYELSYVNDKVIPTASNEYVLWVDIMGTKNKMFSSVKTASIFMLKLHTAILQNLTSDLIAYPLMDGAYITSKSKNAMTCFITKLFASIGKDISQQKDIQHVFLIKAALAYGPVINGKEIGAGVNAIFTSNEIYKNSILIGLPMVQAFNSESSAPPFGIYIHESARAFSSQEETPFVHKWWKWYLTDQRIWKMKDSDALFDSVTRYFEQAQKKYILEDYAKERIEVHKEMFREYLDRTE